MKKIIFIKNGVGFRPKGRYGKIKNSLEYDEYEKENEIKREKERKQAEKIKKLKEIKKRKLKFNIKDFL